VSNAQPGTRLQHAYIQKERLPSVKNILQWANVAVFTVDADRA